MDGSLCWCCAATDAAVAAAAAAESALVLAARPRQTLRPLRACLARVICGGGEGRKGDEWVDGSVALLVLWW